MDLKHRHKLRLAKQNELASRYGWDLHIVHLASGAVCGATVELAAQLIVDGTHREALPQEVAEYQTHQRREGERIAAAVRRMSEVNGGANARRYEL